jgi:uncharacterized protein YbcC (UPF0753/DUF2309 family)
MSELTLATYSPDIESLESSSSDELLNLRQDPLPQVLADIQAIIPPLWPLKDYVAVNPFLGMSQHAFLAARQDLCEVRDCDLLPSGGYFHSLLQQGVLAHADIEQARRQCVQEYPDLYADLDLATIMQWVDGLESPRLAGERRFHTVSEVVDRWQGSSWTSHMVNDITRHCAAQFDEGQASWSSPWKALPLYAAWREAAQLSHRMDMLGLKGFRRLVAQLPERPVDAIAELLGRLGIPTNCWRSFLLCEMFSVAGWASFVKYRVREAEYAGRHDEDLIGLLAIRLAYDVALAQVQAGDAPSPLDLCPAEDSSLDLLPGERLSPPPHVLARYTLQVAAEIAYRRKLCAALTATREGTQRASARKTLQMIFCIDVRSEVMRRHLESISEAIETCGFAGFFGMPLEYVSLDGAQRAAQCPVLLQPSFQVRQNLLGASPAAQGRAVNKRRTLRTGRKLWKSFQSSAISCFSFVESLGLLYFGKLLTDSLRLTRPVAAAEQDGVPLACTTPLGPDVHVSGSEGLSSEQKVQLAAGMLRNLGLTAGFARIVAVCGHAAEVVNNPYQAGLDCGACGGHSGEPNARVAAALLNDRQVRAGLAGCGIHIPEDTWFVPAVHNTTTDEIRFFDTGELPATHRAEFAQVQAWVLEAGAHCRLERSARLGNSPAEDLLRRSRDWSEVRPEWGLAGNAAFIVAPRSRTAGLNLGGRTFLHNYEYAADPELKTLELIMTAPMIVTSWINLQYYASAVDNRAFGSGNKVIHNVIGQVGVVQGNGGDLMTGLPWQSVHDGERFQHEPLRLLVVIEAPRHAVQRIIQQHSVVRELVSNGWVSLVVLEDHCCYRWAEGRWQAE